MRAEVEEIPEDNSIEIPDAIEPPEVERTSAETLESKGFLTTSGMGGDPGTEGLLTPEKLAAMQPYPGVDYLGTVRCK